MQITAKMTAVDVFQAIDENKHLCWTDAQRQNCVAILENAQAICVQLVGDLEANEWSQNQHWLGEIRTIERYLLIAKMLPVPIVVTYQKEPITVITEPKVLPTKTPVFWYLLLFWVVLLLLSFWQ